jgi:predicted nucleic acid-binding protein
MAAELMRPLTRNQYFDCLLAATAWNAAVGWLMLNTVVAIALLRVMHDQVSLSNSAMFVLLSGVITLATFGLSARTATWKSAFQRVVVLMLGSLILATPMLAWWSARDKVGDWPFIAVAIAMGGAGVALIMAARRAWMNCEFA